MSRSESWKTWVIVGGLLIFAGLASAAWPFISEQLDSGGSQVEESESEPVVVTIEVGDYVLGNELLQIPFISENIDGLQFTAGQVFLIAFGLVLAAVGVTGLIFAVLTLVLSKQVTVVLADEEYQAAVAELDNREKEKLKAIHQAHPKEPPPDQEKAAGWSVTALSFIILFFVGISALLLGITIFGDTTYEVNGREVNPVAILNVIILLITIVILFLVFRRRKPDDLESAEADYRPVNWGTIWIILSGLLIVGLGAGLALAVRAAGSG